MKTVISIPLVLLILFTGININIASHYCGGNISGTKVSLTGELASCGMEHQSGNKSSLPLISSHCCDDVISSCAISTIYVPSFFSVPDHGLDFSQTSNLPTGSVIGYDPEILILTGIKRPPGNYIPDCHDQQVLCIFRI
jgi:hypothetical protein